MSSDEAGFTLIEILMVLVLLGILVSLSLSLVWNTSNEAKFTETVARMHLIQNAILGDPDIRQGGIRTSFGFLGDVGFVPTVGQGIASLVTNPGLPAYAISSTTRIGLGWNGPYLTAGNSATIYTQDAWGNSFVYDGSTLTSYGADLQAGGTGYDQDIAFTLPATLQTTTVYGFVCQSGGPLANSADVVINYPGSTGGVLVSTCLTVALASAGQFSFTSIPLGVRSITVYVPSNGCSATPPAATLGPVVITVDKPNYVVPCNQLDISP